MLGVSSLIYPHISLWSYFLYIYIWGLSLRSPLIIDLSAVRVCLCVYQLVSSWSPLLLLCCVFMLSSLVSLWTWTYKWLPPSLDVAPLFWFPDPCYLYISLLVLLAVPLMYLYRLCFTTLTLEIRDDLLLMISYLRTCNQWQVIASLYILLVYEVAGFFISLRLSSILIYCLM